MMRNHGFGNVRNKELWTIFKGQMEKINSFWKLNLDKIERCTGCEFSYACGDGKALEESLAGKLEGKILCGYSPEDGAWL
jgi:radical SAM protein with 4Fe4S-binding SPASM domain